MKKDKQHYWSLSRVARETGKSKSVISKAIENGILSYAQKKGNSFQIDPSEVQRVYGEDLLKISNSKKNDSKERSRTFLDKDSNPLKSQENNKESNYNSLNNNIENKKNDKERTFFLKGLEYEIKALEERLLLKDDYIRVKDERINELQIEREDWKKQANTLLLSYDKKQHVEESRAQKNSNLIWSISIFAILISLLSLITLKIFTII